MKPAEKLRRLAVSALLLSVLEIGACSARPPLVLAEHVDVPRFMGSWFVIACIPTRIERDAYAAVESYQLEPGGRVRTVFSFRKGGFDGPAKRYHPTGFIHPEGNGAIWDMQFIWPLRADYRILYVDADYTLTVIGRPQRDFAWIMARSPQIAPADYERLRTLLLQQGYDVSLLRQVPQQPP
ncbi:MAG: lipocalin family protein [Proteobacteria bacterium]|nr:lipocalin family protein [Pseudomonadota bacterium]